MDYNVINTGPLAGNDQQPKSSGQIISIFLRTRSATFRELAALRQEACELRAETRRTPDTFLYIQARAKTDGL